ncbi:MAG: sulfatase-like hydrolase/transferase [Bacteroidales bacterium]
MKKINLFNLCVLACIVTSCSTGKPDPRPNILFIISDDQCYKTVNAMGGEEVITPSLDQLAGEGLAFTHAYNMGGWHGAVCVASRTMLNTGLSVWRANRAETSLDQWDEQGMMWSNLMENAGYETFMAGKWHVKIEPDSIFQHTGHIRGGMPKQTPEGYNRPKGPDDKEWTPWDTRFGGFWEGGKHWSEVLADEAVTFLERAKGSDDPFFMYVAFNAPHDPRQSPKEYVDMYPLENISVPASFQPLYPDMELIGCGKGLRDEKLAPFPRTEYAVKVNRQEYYAIISHMDSQLERILEALETSGKRENTYVVFTSDHGLSCGNHGLLGKQNMYDHSIRVPLFVTGPGIPRGKRVGADVYLQDVMPTILELAGAELPGHIEYHSLLPFTDGSRSKSHYDAIYGCYRDEQRMVRYEDFKLILYPYASEMLLFDLENDPDEIVNLAGEDGYRDRIARMFEKFITLQVQMEDTLDMRDFFPEMFIN